MLHIIKTTREPQPDHPKVGQCIYCLATPTSGSILTREHVVPAGIGGDIVLPSASCQSCQQHIHRYESRVALGHFGHIRSALGLNSKRKRGKGYQRPTKYYTRHGGPVEVGQRIDDSPKVYHNITPSMPVSIFIESSGVLPTILTGQDPSKLNVMVPSVFFNLGNHSGNFLFQTSGGVMLGEFSRFVAKVAHGYAVACLGLSGFRPYLTDFILGSGSENLPQYVGITELVENTDSSSLHRLDLVVAPMQAYKYPLLPPVFATLVIVYIDFFCTNQLPGMAVVVGEMPSAAINAPLSANK